MVNVTEQIRMRLTANAEITKKDLMLSNFLGGLAWGVGSVIGATIVVAILLGLLRNLNFLPFIGDISGETLEVVKERAPTKSLTR